MYKTISIYVEDSQTKQTVNAEIAATLGIKDGDRLDREQSRQLTLALKKTVEEKSAEQRRTQELIQKGLADLKAKGVDVSALDSRRR